jgi:hypothetical protein
VVAIYAVLFPGLRRVDRLDSRQPLGERSVAATRKGLIAASVGPPAADGAGEALAVREDT